MTSFTLGYRLRLPDRVMDVLSFENGYIQFYVSDMCQIHVYETSDQSKSLHRRRFITVQHKLVFTKIIKVRLIRFLKYFSKTAPKIVVALLNLTFSKVCVPFLVWVGLKMMERCKFFRMYHRY